MFVSLTVNTASSADLDDGSQRSRQMVFGVVTAVDLLHHITSARSPEPAPAERPLPKDLSL